VGMSWTHSICLICWENNQPGREPVTVKCGKEVCCFCGRDTEDGIYIREDPKELRCQGKHEEE